MSSGKVPGPLVLKPLSTQGRNLAIQWICSLISFLSEHIVDNFGKVDAGISPDLQYLLAELMGLRG